MAETKLSDIYEAIVPKKAPDATNLEIEGPAVPKGKVVRLDMFYVYDHTTANKTIRLGFNRGGTKYWFRQEPAGTNTHGLAQHGKTILVDGDKPVGMIESPTASDVCYLVARGEYL